MLQEAEETAVYPDIQNDQNQCPQGMSAQGGLLLAAEVRKVRIQGWTTMSAEELWRCWAGQFASQEEAIASAIWVGNRLAKSSKNPDAIRKFYSIKEHWLTTIQDSVGRRVRLEQKICFRCDGNGCERCGYSGIFEERWLYEHEFAIGDQFYQFHGYTPPKSILPEMGQVAFGAKFGDEDIKELALPFSGLVRMLGYVAVVVMGLTFNGRRYVGRTLQDDYIPPRPVVRRPKFVTPDNVRHWWMYE